MCFLGSRERQQDVVGERENGGHFTETEARDDDGQSVAGAGRETTGETCRSLAPKHVHLNLSYCRQTDYHR